jgi:hypothetical protein
VTVDLSNFPPCLLAPKAWAVLFQSTTDTHYVFPHFHNFLPQSYPYFHFSPRSPSLLHLKGQVEVSSILKILFRITFEKSFAESLLVWCRDSSSVILQFPGLNSIILPNCVEITYIYLTFIHRYWLAFFFFNGMLWVIYFWICYTQLNTGSY